MSSSNGRIAPRSDRYQVVERLGEGGMAVVFRAADNVECRFCALKVLLPEYRDNATVRARFRAEAMAMIDLRHRNVIEVWDAQVDGPEPFFAMELAMGGSVVDWIREYGPMPPRMAVDVAIQVCKGLRAAHDRGIVHRDVKPHNILVDRRGVCKLTDFGIARHDGMEGLTIDGRGMGTLGYIAPEQKGKATSVDARADIYSTGATLHTLLRGETTLDLYLASEEPEMLYGIPEALHGPIIKATRYRPADRYPTISDFARELHEAKFRLPEDPPDTPPIVLGEATYAEDEIYRFVSDPRNSMNPEPMFGENDATSSVPSIDRASLLRQDTEDIEREQEVLTAQSTATDEEDDALIPRQILVPGAMILGSTPLWALLLVLIVLTSTRGQALSRSTDTVYAERAKVLEILEEDIEMIDELVQIGADREPLEKAFAEARSASGYEVAHASHRVVMLASDEANEHRPHESQVTIGASRSADQRIKRLAAAVNELAYVENYDAEIRNDGIGRIATLLGLAPELDQ